MRNESTPGLTWFFVSRSQTNNEKRNHVIASPGNTSNKIKAHDTFFPQWKMQCFKIVWTLKCFLMTFFTRNVQFNFIIFLQWMYTSVGLLVLRTFFFPLLWYIDATTAVAPIKWDPDGFTLLLYDDRNVKKHCRIVCGNPFVFFIYVAMNDHLFWHDRSVVSSNSHKVELLSLWCVGFLDGGVSAINYADIVIYGVRYYATSVKLTYRSFHWHHPFSY